MTGRASAPGKIMLAGEYAVLAGADAVMIAVDRRVHAWLADRVSGSRSPFATAITAELAAALGPDHPAVARAARVVADSSALRDGPRKLGLGSSAAFTVAATACALARPPVGDAARGATAEPEASLTRIHAIAHAAHGAAQAGLGARGSGADVACSVYGGVAAVRCASDPTRVPEVRRLAPDPGVELCYAWTGTSASTPALVARIHAWRDARPRAYDRAIAAIAQAAQDLIAALAPDGTPADRVAALARAGRATAALGEAAGVALETDVHRTVNALATAHGGAAKPTGAGAGDIAVAAFADPEGAAAFRADAAARGIVLLPLAISTTGVIVEPSP